MADAPRVCQACGRVLQPQSRFCPQCGARWQAPEAPLGPSGVLKGGDYVIVRPVTRGGMGAVYLAQDRRAFDRPCIVKQMLEYYDSADPAERDRAAQRFEEEGRTLASLSHPGAPQIYTFFQENGRYYIVMEYVRGEDLERFVTHEGDDGQLVRARTLPREEVIRYVIQVCDILEYLHSQPRPVIHQDIKPANLMLDRQRGLVRLVDFGTARIQPQRAARSASDADQVAAGGAPRECAYGTDGYAPPEQYRGQAVPQSDVFALAATAYHLLTDDDPRQHPFKFPRMAELPKELSAALERALRTSPQDRSSARELRQALEALSVPQRTLETFAFPGGTQIRSVAALPMLSDEHWDAARAFLYNGDFQRWLRDLNRHDLALAADEIVKHESNHDAGLETFLHSVDPGLPHPKLVCDPGTVDLGSVGRVKGLTRRITLLNTRRGYVQVQVQSSEPWVEVYPEIVNLWSGVPSDVRVRVLAEGLPLRRRQQATLIVSPKLPGKAGHAEAERAPVEGLQIPVVARVSLWREALRLTLRTLMAAGPSGWCAARLGWEQVGRVAQRLARPFVGRRWLLALTWLLLGALLSVGLYLLPDGYVFQVGAGTLLSAPTAWHHYIAPALLGPPVIASLLWFAFVVCTVIGRALVAAIVGGIKSFSR